MYTIKAYVDSKEYTIHDARVKALTVGGNPYFEIGDNINGSATFKVFPTHPYYDKVTKLTTDIVIYRDDEPEFYGRVLYDDEDFSGTKKVFVEGEGILSGVLAEIRANAANELADDTARYEEELKAHYEAEMKEKEDLITLFENPDLPGTTPEGEPKPDLGGEPEPDPEEKTVIEKKHIGGETVVEEVE